MTTEAKTKTTKSTKVKSVQPVLTEVAISYSIGVKCNLGKQTYESADAHFSQTERYSVEGMDEVAVSKFVEDRREGLKEVLDVKVEKFYEEQSCFA